MCLTICSESHIFNKHKGRYVPKIALKRIKVYKVLIWSKGVYKTPFQIMPVFFNNGKAVINSNMYDHYQTSWYKGIVCEGVHAFRTRELARNLCRHLNKLQPIVFEAYIPPFTRYFIGDRGDIVSEKLIVKKYNSNICV